MGEPQIGSPTPGWQLLGPVRLFTPGAEGAGVVELDPGPGRQRLLAVALLLTPGRPVATGTLVRRIWGDRPPRAANPVAPLASRLRRSITPPGAARGPGWPGTVRFVTGGYQIDCEPALIDLHRARAAADAARAALAGGDRERAVTLFETAITGWQPTALAGLSGDWAERTRAQLADERIGLFLERAAVELGLGRHERVVDEIRQPAADRPDNEALVAVQMRALAGAGRGAEALRLYVRTRQVLADDLGVDPSPMLSALNVQILRGDPAVVRVP
jgi:DNA-binding SARP family transcriptional activator